MPLRDHFHSPAQYRASWDVLHGQWPAMIVLQLNSRLPPRYVAGPLVHLGSEIDEYEVQVFDLRHDRSLVAAIEIVSPSNKDRPEIRRVFTAKCAALLRRGVSVAIVDVVTSRRFNLYAELLEVVGQQDPTFGPEPPATYAASCRTLPRDRKCVLESSSHELKVGRELPTLPIWLADNFAVPLDLESCYEDTCRALRIP